MAKKQKTQGSPDLFAAPKRLTLDGNIVISVGLFGHSGDDKVWTEGTKGMLDDMHKRKIEMEYEIFVINVVGGYIGSSTRSEIEYAKEHGKVVMPVSLKSRKCFRLLLEWWPVDCLYRYLGGITI